MSKRAEEAASKAYPDDNFVSVEYADMCRSFYQEAYEQAEKDLGWHSVEESLPPVDEEVIVLTDEINDCLLPDASFVGVGHIVDRRYAMDYNGWNVPGVRYWMPMPKLPKEEEQ